MIYLDDLKYMKMYKKQFLAPVNKKDTKHGSVIMLLTPNKLASHWLMNNRFMVNRNNCYQSYYIEKDINYIINHENMHLETEYNDLSPLNESGSFIETSDIIIPESNIISEAEINEFYCRLGDNFIFFNEMYDEDVYNEVANMNQKYKKFLYFDRIRNNKQMIELYKQVKADEPKIKKTFINLKRYKKLNLFVDLYYYISIYLKNNNLSVLRSVDMYFEFIRRFIMDKRIDNAGYEKKTVFVPINFWEKNDINAKLTDFRKQLNPIAIWYKKLRLSPEDLNVFGDIDFVFFGENGYFKLNSKNIDTTTHTKFLRFTKILEDNEPIEDDNESDNSVDGITSDIVDKLETNKGIKIYNITGNSNSDDENEKLKDELVKKVNDAAKQSSDEDSTLDKLDEDEEFKQILLTLQDDADDNIKLSSSRLNRINKAQDDLMNKTLKSKSIKEMVNESNKPKELKETEIPIKTINDEWKHMKAINFEKEYDLDADIVKILNSLSDTNKYYPVSILDISIEDTSTSEDSIYTYTVKCEDYKGKRFTLKFDIPKFRDNRFMRLRGNEKIFSIEMPLIPISKTDSDTVQIVSFYNKIFIERYNTSTGKSTTSATKIIKALSKYEGNDVEIYTGDNSKICDKYELPIDYIDLASIYDKIIIKNKSYKDTVTIYFNQDEIRSLPGIDPLKGLPVAVRNDGTIYYYTGSDVDGGDLTANTYSGYITRFFNDELFNLYDKQTSATKQTYSRASILNTDIPVIVILAYDLGLTKAMELAGIKYEIVDKNPRNIKADVIKLEDGYIMYELNYTSSMLMNGLKECNMEDVKIQDLNSKMTWLEQLDNFGGRIKADGLDNFHDLMYDPITVEVSRDYGLPETYHEALIYASNLLVDNKYTQHTDLSTNRYRTNEVIAAQFYRAISDSYKDYALQNKHGRQVGMTIKQSAVIDLILAQNTTSDLSIFQPLLELEVKNTISTKGVTGMNSDRAYKMDKRGYDKSMLNIIAQSTGFASTVGINRQTTINPNIVGGRGYFKPPKEEDISITNTFGMTEALTPFMITSDDPFRNDMTFVQTAKHSTPIEYGTPSLVTTGADVAMPYLSSDMFAFKAKYNGKVKELNDKYMIIEYNNGKKDYINLDNQTMKNSDGGFFINLKLKTDLKLNQSVKQGQIVAYDSKSFSNRVGDHKQLAYNPGALIKCAIMTTEDGFEDSGIISEWLSNAMASEIVVCKDVSLPPQTNILQICKKGQTVKEGDPILIFQNAFDEEDANLLLKNLNDEDGDVSTIGRMVIKSKVTGTISDIKVYRTCELDELSDSLKKIVKSNESTINKYKNIAKGSLTEVHFDSTEKLPATGKLKYLDGVLIEIYMSYYDKMSIGDKIVAGNANKNVIYNIYDSEDSPYTDFRPNEKIDAITSASSIDGRMVLSPIKIGAINKIMIELQRKVCDIYGIKWKDLHEIMEDETNK